MQPPTAGFDPAEKHPRGYRVTMDAATRQEQLLLLL